MPAAPSDRLPRALGALLALAGLLGPAGCRAAAAPDHRLRVGIVFHGGGKDDRSFNAAAWQGASRAARELPIELRTAEPGDGAATESALRVFAERNYGLIVGIGAAQAPALDEVAASYPALDFVLIDAVSRRPNVASLVFKESEGSYLVGMIAARTSKSGVLGFIGGMNVPPILAFETGYEQGARSVAPRVRVISNYVGLGGSAWNDPARGKELALAQIARGADVVFAVAGNSGLGAFDAAEQTGTFVIGVDSNQNWIKPGRVLTSMVKRIDSAVYQVVTARVAGRFRGGVQLYDLRNDGVGYAIDRFNAGLIPAPVLAEVEAAKHRIVDGTLRVGAATETAEAATPRSQAAPGAAGGMARLLDFSLARWRGAGQLHIEDAYKWLFQAVLGGEHAAPSAGEAHAWLAGEWQTLASPHPGEPLWVPLRPDGTLGRLNLRPFRARGGRMEEILAAFVASAGSFHGERQEFVAVWRELGRRLGQSPQGELTPQEWSRLERAMSAAGYPAIHHSPAFETAYQPAYRVLTGEEAKRLLAKPAR